MTILILGLTKLDQRTVISFVYYFTKFYFLMKIINWKFLMKIINKRRGLLKLIDILKRCIWLIGSIGVRVLSITQYVMVVCWLEGQLIIESVLNGSNFMNFLVLLNPQLFAVSLWWNLISVVSLWWNLMAVYNFGLLLPWESLAILLLCMVNEFFWVFLVYYGLELYDFLAELWDLVYKFLQIFLLL
jgi:hypothetical protein